VKPIDAAALAASASKTGAVLAVEEHNIYGGFGGAVAEALAKHSPARMDFIGVQDRFTESGPYDALMKKYGISVEAIVAKAKLHRSVPAPAAAPVAMRVTEEAAPEGVAKAKVPWRTGRRRPAQRSGPGELAVRMKR
jgi:hypothetical protein